MTEKNCEHKEGLDWRLKDYHRDEPGKEIPIYNGFCRSCGKLLAREIKTHCGRIRATEGQGIKFF